MIYLKIRYLTIQCNNSEHYFQFKGLTIAQCCTDQVSVSFMNLIIPDVKL